MSSAQTAHAPFTKWSDTDHAGAVIIVTTLCLLYWAFAGVGQQVLAVTSGLQYNWADGLFTFSMVTGFAQSVLVLVSASHGLGKSASVLSSGSISSAEEIYKVSNIFYVLCLGFIKCSAACFTANLTVKNMGSLRQVRGKEMIGLYVTLGLSILWTIAAIVTLAVPCPSYGGAVNATGMCMGTMARWGGIFAGDAISDIAIVAFAASVIWRTKASVSKRLTWYIPFLVRACVPIWAGLRLLTISHRKLTRDPTINVWLFICMSQIQILLALIGAASPVLKKAMSDLVTNFGAQTDSQGDSKMGPSFAMKYLQKRSRRTGQTSQPTDSNGSRKPLPFSGSSVGGSAMVSRSRHEEKVRSDGDSTEGIIRQDDYEVSYFHHDSPPSAGYGPYR